MFLTSGLVLAMHFGDAHFQVLSQIFKIFRVSAMFKFRNLSVGGWGGGGFEHY